jgi:hypothetical protein
MVGSCVSRPHGTVIVFLVVARIVRFVFGTWQAAVENVFTLFMAILVGLPKFNTGAPTQLFLRRVIAPLHYGMPE